MEEIEVDDDVWNMLEQIERRARPAATTSVTIPYQPPVNRPVTTHTTVIPSYHRTVPHKQPNTDFGSSSMVTASVSSNPQTSPSKSIGIMPENPVVPTNTRVLPPSIQKTSSLLSPSTSSIAASKAPSTTTSPPQSANNRLYNPPNVPNSVPLQNAGQSRNFTEIKQNPTLHPSSAVSTTSHPPITRKDIGGAQTLKIEFNYGGRSRIRVTISAELPVPLFSSKYRPAPQVSESKPIITSQTLPPTIKEAFDRVTQGQNTHQWDVPSELGEWPLYEESRIDLESRTNSVLAHWFFPTRLLPQIELQIRRVLDGEIMLQSQVEHSQRVTIRMLSLPDYVRRLILECNKIYRESVRIASLTPVGPISALEISGILPPALLDRDLFKALKDYQVQGVEYGYLRNGRLLLADSPGLGKTIQAIALACCYEQDWPVLVICPSSVRAMWANEFQRWVPNLGWNDISTNFTGRKTSLKAKVNIISYELLKSPKIIETVWTNMPGGARTHPFGVVICDECHLLKSWKAARTQAIMPLVQRAKRAILLSGTPATSRPSELHTQLSCILPHVFNYFPAFGERYCDPQPQPFGSGVTYTGASNLNELHLLLTEALMIRRQKAEVLGDMPSKRRHQLLLEIPKEQRKTLVAMSKKMVELSQSITQKRKAKKSTAKKSGAQLAEFNDEEAIEDNAALDVNGLRGRQRQMVLELFQNAGRAKLPSAIAHLEECLQNSPSDVKYLVFAHHIDVLDGFCHALHTKGIEYIRIDGRTQNTQRQPLVDHFQSADSCRVAILSILAAGVGITLTKASKVFFAELYWDPSTLLQAEDRAHRFGQNKDVDVFYMIAKGSYDEKLWDAVDAKLSVLSAVLDAKQNQMKLDSVSRTAANSNSNDSFIQYLLQKIDGFHERSEEANERARTRQKARNGTLNLDDDDAITLLEAKDNISDSDSDDVLKPLELKTPQQQRKYSKKTSAVLPSSHLPEISATVKAKSATSTVHVTYEGKKRQISSISPKQTSALPPNPLDDDSWEISLEGPPFKKMAGLEAAPAVIPSHASSAVDQPQPSSPPKPSTDEIEKRRAAKFKMFAVAD